MESLPTDEAAKLSTSGRKPGGWITFPFMIATMGGLSLAAGGWVSNLIVYLIEEYNVKSIEAAQIYNVFNGCIALFPIIGAIIADSFLGCFSVIWISSLISLLGMVLLVLTAGLEPLRPSHCDNGSNLCTDPSKIQLVILYAGLVLSALGVGGTRFTLATMGANQFDKPKHQGIFFNWYLVALYVPSVISTTAIVYVQDNVSWASGFGICVAANVLGLAIFLLGSPFYRHVRPQGSPFMGLARVVVAAVNKRKVQISMKGENYYQELHDGSTSMMAATPTQFFKFLNRAALKTEGDIGPNGSIAKPWKLCPVQQVEDLKSLIRIFPLWSTGVFLSIPIVIQSSLPIIQALTMDRHLGSHFQIPSGSIIVFILISTSITIIFIDRVLFPTLEKFSGRPLTPLKRVGIGHVLTGLSMAVAALVESSRLKMEKFHHLQDQNGAVVPMSVMWLVPQLAIVGIGEAFHFPGNVAFYYQEFPATLKSTSTAMVALFMGISYYLGNSVMDLLRRVTGWLPDNINDGRLDNVYWVCAALSMLNFVYYLVCAWLYKYQNAEEAFDNSSKPEK
ncbi:unnamed protein product [Ilex paraguariensis]|uniref:Uncharacterized protein n=1 Tax=Ilex paraguariensis TaxID=185542 RepID=A0ABC8TL47_9AQUA